MAQQTIDDELVAELAREAVAKTAPQELPLFRATKEAYFRDPEGTLRAQKAKDEMLGFGVETAVTLLAPIALAVGKDVIQYLVAQAGEAAKDEGGPRLRRLVRRMFGKTDGAEPAAAEAVDDPEPPALTPEQLAEVRAIAVEKARQLNVPPEQAELLADAMVGDLVTAPA